MPRGVNFRLLFRVQGGAIFGYRNQKTSVRLRFPLNITLRGAPGGAIEGASQDALAVATEGAIEGATDTVKARLKSLLLAIASHEGKRTPEYSELTNIGIKSLERYIKKLKEAELIEFIGDAPQTGGYFVAGQLKKALKKYGCR
ncbi:MAG: hypothetical protein WBQ23_04285 [Bacteroidota bacterium]